MTPLAPGADGALETLHRVFGYASFRGPQAAIIDHLSNGGDALVLMPTGGGKSLCYQIPALLRPGVGVVVSPLIALMQDQVDALLQAGVRAAYLNSSQDWETAAATERALRNGELDLIYVAPERLFTDRFLALLDELESRQRIALFAIDEAHCVSQWGHDFRPEQGLSLHPSLKLLERGIAGLHVGGKSALEWHGVRHYVAQQGTLHLYGWKTARLPDWFLTAFPAEYHRKRLFEEKPEALLHVAPFEGRSDAPLVSASERALLELLSEIGVRQPLSEARELMESTYNLRGVVLQELLKRCTRVKTVRLCLTLGRELSLPWAEKLNPAELPTGSRSSWVCRLDDGVLVLKP